jgi:hypothetical protein
MRNADNPIRQELVQNVAKWFAEKSEDEREEALRAFELSDEEKELVRDLWRKEQESPGLLPEALRQESTFKGLIQRARRGECLLFLGSGVSREVGMPTTDQLVEALVARGKALGIIPQEKEAKDYRLSEIAWLVEKEAGKTELARVLKDRFDIAIRAAPEGAKPYQRGAFRLIPYLSGLNEQILTTNWDDLVERSFEEIGEVPFVVRRDTDMPYRVNARHSVIKLHGDFADPDTMVITEMDYGKVQDDIRRVTLGSLWGLVGTLLAQYSFIFVGYGFMDPHIKLIRTFVDERLKPVSRQHYIVGPYSEDEVASLQDREEVKVISAKSINFFTAVFQELQEFANREDDLHRIFRKDASAFMEVYSHFGAGKSALLDEVQRKALAYGWTEEQIVRVDFRPKGKGEKSPRTRPEMMHKLAGAIISRRRIERVEHLLGAMEDKGNLFVSLDSMEEIADCKDCINFIANDVASTLQRMIEKGNRCRFILAGRFPVETWPFIFRRTLTSFPLYPFTLSAVREMAGKYVMAEPKALNRPSPRLCQQIYDITGKSHPGFIKDLLSALIARSRQPDGSVLLPSALTPEEIREFLATFSKQVDVTVWDIEDPIERKVRDLLSAGLCVFRWVNKSLLRKLAGTNTFAPLFTGLAPEEVFDALRKRHLLRHVYPVWELDPVIRRIKAQYLHHWDSRAFTQAHSAAGTIFHSMLPTQVDNTQLPYLREWLYHKAVQLRQEFTTEDERWEALKVEVEKVQYRTLEQEPAEMGYALVRQIEEGEDRDTELFDELLACLGETPYGHLRQMLIEKREVRT